MLKTSKLGQATAQTTKSRLIKMLPMMTWIVEQSESCHFNDHLNSKQDGENIVHDAQEIPFTQRHLMMLCCQTDTADEDKCKYPSIKQFWLHHLQQQIMFSIAFKRIGQQG